MVQPAPLLITGTEDAPPRRGLCLFGFLRADSPLPGPLPLFAEHRVEVVAAGPIAAALVTVDLALFDPDPAEPDALVPLVLDFHEGVAALFTQAPLIPLRFGTILPSREALTRLMKANEGALLAELDRLAGLAEWSFTIRLEAPKAAVMPETQGGTAFLLARRQQRSQKEEGREHGAALATALHDTIADLAAAATPVVPDGHGPAWKFAALLRPETLAGARRAAEDLARACAVPARVEVVGPWPPYSFVTVTLHG